MFCFFGLVALSVGAVSRFRARPRALRRPDRGTPRLLPQDKMEYYCELIAALKVRTSNKKGTGLQREGLGRASQRETARDQIIPKRPTGAGPDPGVAE